MNKIGNWQTEEEVLCINEMKFLEFDNIEFTRKIYHKVF